MILMFTMPGRGELGVLRVKVRGMCEKQRPVGLRAFLVLAMYVVDFIIFFVLVLHIKGFQHPVK